MMGIQRTVSPRWRYVFTQIIIFECSLHLQSKVVQKYRMSWNEITSHLIFILKHANNKAETLAYTVIVRLSFHYREADKCSDTNFTHFQRKYGILNPLYNSHFRRIYFQAYVNNECYQGYHVLQIIKENKNK